jgi:hypothetical protein
VPSPFPGMDPFLEATVSWPHVHVFLITKLAEAINRNLPRPYWVSVERHSYLVDEIEIDAVTRPDAAIIGVAEAAAVYRASTSVSPIDVRLPLIRRVSPAYLRIKDPEPGSTITIVEILSPANKYAGDGRTAYLRKRNRILSSATHLVEVDLLRAGPRMPIQGKPPECSYCVTISRSERRPNASMYAFNIQDPLPSIPIPLRDDDSDVVVDLGAVLSEAYIGGGFDRWVHYERPVPPPKLKPADLEWVEATLRDHGCAR